MTTQDELRATADSCRKVFKSKLDDYGASWRILRPESVTDQLYIKAKRIRQIETTGVNLVGDSIESELTALINYSMIGLVQLQLGFADCADIDADTATAHYDQALNATLALIEKKNHDYGEAWREMRTSSYTDLILTKIQRIKQIEDHGGRTAVSEGTDSNLMDIAAYALFGLIKA